MRKVLYLFSWFVCIWLCCSFGLDWIWGFAEFISVCPDFVASCCGWTLCPPILPVLYFLCCFLFPVSLFCKVYGYYLFYVFVLCVASKPSFSCGAFEVLLLSVHCVLEQVRMGIWKKTQGRVMMLKIWPYLYKKWKMWACISAGHLLLKRPVCGHSLTLCLLCIRLWFSDDIIDLSLSTRLIQDYCPPLLTSVKTVSDICPRSFPAEWTWFIICHYWESMFRIIYM